MATIDYKEKYEQALEVAQRFYNNSVAITKKGLEDIFPELAGSEDEKIRKALIKLVKKAGEGYENVIDGVSIEDAIAWLEKQGSQILDSSAKTCKDEQKPTDCFSRNLCISLGQAFMKGAEWADEHQAEKDLELTWEDIVEIDKLLIDLGMMFPDKSTPDYYKEVLKRFKSNKEK